MATAEEVEQYLDTVLKPYIEYRKKAGLDDSDDDQDNDDRDQDIDYDQDNDDGDHNIDDHEGGGDDDYDNYNDNVQEKRVKGTRDEL